MNGPRIHNLLALTLLFILTGLYMATPGYAAKSVSATLNSHQIPVDRTTVLTITAEGGRSVDINIPEVKNLRFHRRGQSSQIQMINGSFSASISTVYLVEPLAPGKYTIPPISVHSDGEKLFTKPISFEATAGTAQPSQPTGANTKSSRTRLGSGDASKMAFLRISPSQKSVYSGEIIPIRIDAYFSQQIQANIGSRPTLKGDGFVISPLGDKPSRSMRTINDTRYIVLSWNGYLTGIKEGKHNLSLELETELLIPQRSRRSSLLRNHGFFQDDFFSDFFQDYESKMVKLVSPEMNMDIKALPTQGQPKNFSGAIGSFNLKVAATPTEVEVGEPITLTMVIEGTGNFNRVKEPAFPESKQWKHYTPSSDFQSETEHPNKGIKRFEQAVVVRESTVHEIPALTFAYFDPASSQYKQLTSEPIPLTIQGGTQKKTIPASGHDSKDTERTVQTVSEVQSNIEGLAPIKVDHGSLQKSIKPLFSKIWFISMMTLLACVLSCLMFIRLYQRRHERNPDLQRRSEMKTCLKSNFTKIEKALNQNNVKDFLIASRVAIQEQLGHVWRVKGTAITLADLEGKLEPDSNLISIFMMADQAAYAGQTLSTQEMQHLYTQLKDELVKLV